MLALPSCHATRGRETPFTLSSPAPAMREPQPRISDRPPDEDERRQEDAHRREHRPGHTGEHVPDERRSEHRPRRHLTHRNGTRSRRRSTPMLHEVRTKEREQTYPLPKSTEPILRKIANRTTGTRPRARPPRRLNAPVSRARRQDGRTDGTPVPTPIIGIARACCRTRDREKWLRHRVRLL
jgi:hypothetical protein